VRQVEPSVAVVERFEGEDPPIPTIRILSANVAALGFEQHVKLLTQWAIERDRGRMVCAANVHMLIEAERNPRFAALLRSADLVTPDGMPVAWLMRGAGSPNQERVAGMDLLPALCESAEREEVGVYFVGSTPGVLAAIRRRVGTLHPRLRISGMESPPFREMSPEEESQLAGRINATKAGLVFVSLGCPKQERWMRRNRGRIAAVMVGLGAAFPVYAGLQRRAPLKMRELGLEWLYRLAREPHRLLWRYFSTNVVFVSLLILNRGKIARPLRAPSRLRVEPDPGFSA